MNFSKPSLLACCLCASALLVQGCAWFQKPGGAAGTPAPHAGSASVDRNPTNADVSELLGMSFEEATLISPQHIDVPYLPKVAADNIEVLRKFADGKPRKIRAKGRVFMEFNQDHARALCDEALVDGADIIMRGRPILQRGGSTVEGLSDVTVFYLLGPNVRVVGQHRVTNLKGLAGTTPWQGGSGSLLPPLDSSDIPASVRDEMRKAAEAEAQLQRSRVGVPPAFPDPGKPVPEKKP